MTAASDQLTARQPLANIKVVLADSREALEYAYHQGLPKSAVVRTASPALAMEGSLNTEPLEKDISPAKVLELARAFLPFSKNLYDSLKDDPELADFALVVTREAMKFQSLVFKTMALREDDFHEAIAIVSVATGSSDRDAVYNAPWERILRDNEKSQVIVAPRVVVPPNKSEWGAKLSFTTRLKFPDWVRVGERAFWVLFDRLPLTGPRGTVLVLSENDLLRETAFWLVLKGFSLRRLAAPKVTPQPVDEAISKAIRRCVQPVVRPYLQAWIAPSAMGVLEDLFMERALTVVARYQACLRAWTQTLDRQTPKRTVAIMMNFPFTPDAVALHSICRARNLLLVTAQHATSRELNWPVNTAQVYFENNAADLFFTFNRRSAKRSNNENAFAVGHAVSVGMPASFRRAAIYRRGKSDAPPILYVSPTLYIGNLVFIQSGGPDYHKMMNEIDLIENVLARLSHRVRYKPYPAERARYLDQDRILERARAADNITVYEEGLDLRFLLPDSRVIVVSGGMGTIGWALMADKPMVYIDHPYFGPLHPETRAAFEEAVLLFDGGAASLNEDLRVFLSKPLEEIDELWARRADARARLIDEYISTGEGNAGRKAAQIVTDAIRKKQEKMRDQ